MNSGNFAPVSDPESVIGGDGSVADEQAPEHDRLIKEIITIEREYFFEKRNAKTERQRKLRELIERHTRTGENSDDSD